MMSEEIREGDRVILTAYKARGKVIYRDFASGTFDIRFDNGMELRKVAAESLAKEEGA
jgi:hypothetical protein